jgi:hypothetical protein
MKQNSMFFNRSYQMLEEVFWVFTMENTNILNIIDIEHKENRLIKVKNLSFILSESVFYKTQYS